MTVYKRHKLCHKCITQHNNAQAVQPFLLYAEIQLVPEFHPHMKTFSTIQLKAYQRGNYSE